MPIFSKPDHDPFQQLYTNPKNSQETVDEHNHTRHLRKELDDLVYAKKVVNQNTMVALNTKMPANVTRVLDTYIRLSPSGKTVYDPRERYSITEDCPDFVRRTCKNTGGFVRVTNKVFQKYLDFLENESESLFKECNRLVFRL